MSEVVFWNWFAQNAKRLSALGNEADDETLDEIQENLQRYCPKLWFEIGGAKGGPLEFVISAEGDMDYFADVRRLAESAPAMPGWNVIAFKQAHGFSFVTDYDGTAIDPSKCWFLPLTSAREPGRVALRVAVPEDDPSLHEVWLAGLYVVIDTGLGELVSSQRVPFIEVCTMPADPEGDGFIRLDELGDYIAHVSRTTDA